MTEQGGRQPRGRPRQKPFARHAGFCLPLALAFALAVAAPGVAHARGRGAPTPAGQSYYARVNLHYDARNEIATLNEHVLTGERIPVGTRVSVRSRSETRVEFSAEGRGEFALVIDRWGRRFITMDELFARVFSAQDPLAPDAPVHKLTRAEQRAIADGILTEGMRREAVLMAVGYPSPHTTRSLDNNHWTYWTSRRRSFRVTFDADGKIAEFRGYSPADTAESAEEEDELP